MSNIERCWVCTKVGASLDADGVVVMWDTASADYYRERGWTVVEFVPATHQGAVGAITTLREALREVCGHSGGDPIRIENIAGDALNATTAWGQ